MTTEAIFDKIAPRLYQELSKATQSIYIAVAWFTNKEFFEVLKNKAKEGVLVQVIITKDSTNMKSGIAYESLNIGKSGVFFVGGKKDLMHNKFCVIDEKMVINGSYNWSYSAEYDNHENIVITTGDEALVEQFIAQFKRIRNTYHATQEQEALPIAKIIKRLEIIKNFIQLEEEGDIAREERRLKMYEKEKDISLIINLLQKNLFAQAVSKIDEYIKKYSQLTIFEDVSISALKLEIRFLEHQLNAYDNEKIELDKILVSFNHRHTKEVGHYISRLLYLRKQKAKNDPKAYEEAQKDEQEYNEQRQAEEQKKYQKLTQDQEKELKQKFRKATTICHPDKVSEELKEVAQEIFIRLKQAYDENDLQVVSEILEELEKGNFKPHSEKITEKDKLQLLVENLRSKIKALEQMIFSIKESEEYQKISRIENWDFYFEDLKNQLIGEIERLEQELGV